MDILILSNSTDGMAVVYGSDLRVERKQLSIGEEYGSVRFAVLGRYAERIWGTGAPGYPDSVFYSRPYSPLDWSADEETPEQGGGVINQPTWDGECFIALQTFGGYLLAVKPGTVFEIRGTDPASFTIGEAYGTDGPVAARTICTDRTSMFFLTGSGLGMYDGSTLRLLSRDALRETMDLRASGCERRATACVCGHVYYLALSIREQESNEIAENNAVIEYDTERGTFMLRKGMRVRDFYALDGKLYFTQADAPYEVMAYRDMDARGYSGRPMTSIWETAWLDLGKKYVKQDFELRFTAQADEDDFPMELTLETERRKKTRVVMLSGKRKDYRVRIQNAGKRIRLTLKTGRRAAGFAIHGGVQINFTIEEG